MDRDYKSTSKVPFGTGKRKREGSADDVVLSLPGNGYQPHPKKGLSPKRGWDAWSLAEKDLFFLAVSKFGRNFDTITKEVKTKNYDQVRHFYYRILKKINKLLSIKIDNKDQRQVMHALTCFWQLKRGTDNEKDEFTTDFAQSLSNLMRKDQSEIVPLAATMKNEKPSKAAKVEKVAPPVQPPAPPKVEPANDMDNYVSQFSQFETEPELRIPEKLSIQLIPRSLEIAEIISRSAHNPRLQLTLRAKKSVAQMAEYLEQKWVLPDEDGESVSCITGPIRFYPPSKLFPSHKGWAREDPHTVGEIFVELSYPPTLRLEYTWSVDEPEASPETAAVLNDSGMEDAEEEKQNEPESEPPNESAGYESPKRTVVPVIPAPSPSTPNRFSKLPTADSMSMFEDTSCDGFGTKLNEYAEAACKDFYNHFETSSDLGFDQAAKQDEKNFKTSTFKSMLSK